MDVVCGNTVYRCAVFKGSRFLGGAEDVLDGIGDSTRVGKGRGQVEGLGPGTTESQSSFVPLIDNEHEVGRRASRRMVLFSIRNKCGPDMHTPDPDISVRAVGELTSSVV